LDEKIAKGLSLLHSVGSLDLRIGTAQVVFKFFRKNTIFVAEVENMRQSVHVTGAIFFCNLIPMPPMSMLFLGSNSLIIFTSAARKLCRFKIRGFGFWGAQNHHAPSCLGYCIGYSMPIL
jgi:hypothetical protein